MKRTRKPFAGFWARVVVWAAALACALAPMGPGASAAAETESTILNTLARDIGYWRATHFSAEMPPDIAEALSEGGLSGWRCYEGAVVEQLAGRNFSGATDNLIAYALVALEKEGARTLVGMTWRAKQWGLSYLGEGALLPEREFTIGASAWDLDTRWYEALQFNITYATEGGGTETYGVFPIGGGEDLSFWNPWRHQWRVNNYAKTDASGQGTVVVNGEGGLRVFSVPFARGEGEEAYVPGYQYFTLETLDSISDFPTTLEAAARAGESSLAPFADGTLAVVSGVGFNPGGVNLRKYPTTGSESLAKVRGGVAVEVLSEDTIGDTPWYHVRLGALTGFMSGDYVKIPGVPDKRTGNLSFSPGDPIVAEVTAAGCSLRETPENGADASDTPLAQGTRVRVLAEIGERWLYVAVPDGETQWDVAVEGEMGYVRVDFVLQGVNGRAEE